MSDPAKATCAKRGRILLMLLKDTYRKQKNKKTKRNKNFGLVSVSYSFSYFLSFITRPFCLSPPLALALSVIINNKITSLNFPTEHSLTLSNKHILPSVVDHY